MFAGLDCLGCLDCFAGLDRFGDFEVFKVFEVEEGEEEEEEEEEGFPEAGVFAGFAVGFGCTRGTTLAGRAVPDDGGKSVRAGTAPA